MISITRSLSELDRLESLQKASLECYRSAVESAEHYVVETDANSTRQHRRKLDAIAKKVRAAETPEELRKTRLSFQGELQEYAGKATHYVKSMQERLTATVRSLADIAESIKRGQGAGDQRLQAGLEQLSTIARSPEIARLCPQLERAIADVEDGASHLRKQNQLVVAQLRDEVHSLEHALEDAKEAAGRDDISGVLNRAEILSRIRGELKHKKTFNLVFVWISSYQYIHRRYGRQCLDDVLVNFCERLCQLADEETPVGRWADDQFVALVLRPKPEAMWIAENMAEQLAGSYLLKGPDWTRETVLRLKTGVVEASEGITEDKLMKAADKLMIALETVSAPVP